MVAISLIIVLALSLLFVRIATVALALTGLSEELARFQTQSAFFGVGFTTKESEAIVGHPVRRRIISAVMILGHAVFATAVSALILSFMNAEKQVLVRLGYISGGVFVLWVVFSSEWINRRLVRLINMALRRWTKLEVRDYTSLFHLSGNYRVIEIQVRPKDWVADKSLSESNLPEEGVLILGIQRRDGAYLGAPTGKTRVYAEDTMILYGRQEVLAELDRRRVGFRGDNAHRKAVAQQQEVVKEQNKVESEQAQKRQVEEKGA